MSGGKRSKPSKADDDAAAVEQLLQEAEDDFLLPLRIDAHTTSLSSALDPDLARRFQALKSAPDPVASSSSSSSSSKTVAAPSSAPKSVDVGGGDGGGVLDGDEWNKILGDDLAARFLALKSSSVADKGSQPSDLAVPSAGARDDDDNDAAGDDHNGVSKKEVDKLMQWAMDAARLDASKGGSEKDDGDEDSGDGASDDDDDDEDEEKKAKEERNKKGKGGKKWFFF